MSEKKRSEVTEIHQKKKAPEKIEKGHKKGKRQKPFLKKY